MRRNSGYRHSKLFVKHSVTLTALTTVFRTDYDGDEFENNHYDVSNYWDFHGSDIADDGKNVDEGVEEQQTEDGEEGSEERSIEYDIEHVQEDRLNENRNVRDIGVVAEQSCRSTSSEFHSLASSVEEIGGGETSTALKKLYERHVSNEDHDRSISNKHLSRTPSLEDNDSDRMKYDAVQDQYERSASTQYHGTRDPNVYRSSTPSHEGNVSDRSNIINHRSVEEQYERSISNEHPWCTSPSAAKNRFANLEISNTAVVEGQYGHYSNLFTEEGVEDRSGPNSNTAIFDEEQKRRECHWPILSPENDQKGAKCNIHKTKSTEEDHEAAGSIENDCRTLKNHGKRNAADAGPYNGESDSTDNCLDDCCTARTGLDYNAVHENIDEYSSSKSDAGSSRCDYNSSEADVADAEDHARRRVCFDSRSFFYSDNNAVDISDFDDICVENSHHVNCECGGNKDSDDDQASAVPSRGINNGRDFGKDYSSNEHERSTSDTSDNEGRGIHLNHCAGKDCLEDEGKKSENRTFENTDGSDGKLGDERWTMHEHYYRRISNYENLEDSDKGDSSCNERGKDGLDDSGKRYASECSNGFHSFYSYYSDDIYTTDTAETTDTEFTDDSTKSGNKAVNLHCRSENDRDGGQRSANPRSVSEQSTGSEDPNAKYNAEMHCVRNTAEYHRYWASKEDKYFVPSSTDLDSEAPSSVGITSSEHEAEGHELDSECSVVDDEICGVEEKRVPGVNRYRGYWTSRESQYFATVPNENGNDTDTASSRSTSCSDDEDSDHGDENSGRNVVCYTRDCYGCTRANSEDEDDGNEADDEAVETHDNSAHDSNYDHRNYGYYGGEAGGSGDEGKFNSVVQVDGNNRKYVFYNISGNIVFSSCSFRNTVFNFNY